MMNKFEEIESSTKQYRWVLVWGFVLVSAVLCYWNLGQQQLHDWDESLYGINAYEMAQQGDWLNPYYKGRPDEWNVKPPLNAILIIVSHRIWGNTEWGLRFPSATATFIFLLVFYRFVYKEWGHLKTLLTCATLLGCTGLIGSHSGRTGDTDSLFNLFLFLGAISVYRYSFTGGSKWIFAAALWLGIAFYTKATAVLLVFPGLFVFLWINGKLAELFKDRSTWIAVGIFLFFPLSWIISNSLFGADFGNSDFGGSNSWSNSFIYDTLNRFTGTGLFDGIEKKHDFILTFLDSRFNLWHIPFFATVTFLIWKIIQHRKNAIAVIKKSDSLLVFAVCITAPFLLLLQASANVNGWYLVPLLPYFAIITGYGFSRFSQKSEVILYLWIGLAVFTVSRHLVEHFYFQTNLKIFFTEVKAEIGSNNCLYIGKDLTPKQTLYGEWNSSCQYFMSELLNSEKIPTGAFMLTTLQTDEGFDTLKQYERLKLVRKK